MPHCGYAMCGWPGLVSMFPCRFTAQQRFDGAHQAWTDWTPTLHLVLGTKRTALGRIVDSLKIKTS